tara:strand:- start:5368 stop:5973 length:606 start_codon:yes stop_codon:yes gene_type:complete
MTKNHFKALLLSFICCLLSFPVYSNSSEKKLNLISHLKSKYIGRKIQIIDPQTKIPITIKVVNVQKKKDDFLIFLSNKIVMKFVFQTTNQFGRMFLNKDRDESSLKLQSLRSQEKINQALLNFGRSDGSPIQSSSLKNVEQNQEKFFKKNYFTTRHEIIYTDHTVGETASGYFYVTLNGLFLSDGTKIKVRFVKYDNKEKK